MSEAVSVAVHPMELTLVKLGDAAVVVGAGMIGLLVIQALRLAGCSRIIAVDVNETRLKLAVGYGADLCLNAAGSDALAEVRARTSGRSADVGMEVVGTSETMRSAAESLRKGGALTLAGNVSPQVEFPLQWIVTRQIRVMGPCASAGEYPACIDVVARKAIVDRLISATAAPGGRADLVRPLVRLLERLDTSGIFH